MLSAAWALQNEYSQTLNKLSIKEKKDFETQPLDLMWYSKHELYPHLLLIPVFALNFLSVAFSAVLSSLMKYFQKSVPIFTKLVRLEVTVVLFPK